MFKYPMQIDSRSTTMNVDALRHPYPVKPEMDAILLRKNPPSACDVAVVCEPLNSLNG